MATIESIRSVARAVLACAGNVYACHHIGDGRVQDLASRRVYPDEDTWRAATWEDLQARMAARGREVRHGL